MSGSSQKVTEIKKKKNIRERKLLYQISTYLVHKKKKTALYKNVHRQHASLSAS